MTALMSGLDPGHLVGTSLPSLFLGSCLFLVPEAPFCPSQLQSPLYLELELLGDGSTSALAALTLLLASLKALVTPGQLTDQHLEAPCGASCSGEQPAGHPTSPVTLAVRP